ncbi:unnamed protein product [Menidia menidia]|uniref:(Atlantic silverside) hypothetical protein n=1 Tax=Menidia menidia TaxID=238744 RepID=A0A8S4C3U3_9TELE|nr:unnamed protein product [Menidia menidia]
MSEPAWLAADLRAVSDLSPPNRGERMRHSPQNTHSKEDDGKNANAGLIGPQSSISAASGQGI